MRRLLLAAIVIACTAAATPVHRIRDLAYANDTLYAHQLDLYLPATPATAPIAVFVHGGAFIQGDRHDYHFIGEALAAQGITTAVVSYRLFPYATAREATADVALATAWLNGHRTAYGLSARRILLAGHSAGAQVVALLGTDASLLRSAGMSLADICAVLPDAGAYDLRDISGEPDWMQVEDGHIFGETPDARANVSAQLFASPAAPPMLVACGTEDDPDACGRATRFVRALRAAGAHALVIRERGADHGAMLMALANPKDPLNRALHDILDADC